MQHRYSLGDLVTARPMALHPGPYQVVRHLPPVGGEPQYRVRSKVDGHERALREPQIELARTDGSIDGWLMDHPGPTDAQLDYAIIPRDGSYWIAVFARDGTRRFVERFDSWETAARRLLSLRRKEERDLRRRSSSVGHR